MTISRERAEAWASIGLLIWFVLVPVFIACRARHVFELPWAIVLTPLWVPTLLGIAGYYVDDIASLLVFIVVVPIALVLRAAHTVYQLLRRTP